MTHYFIGVITPKNTQIEEYVKNTLAPYKDKTVEPYNSYLTPKDIEEVRQNYKKTRCNVQRLVPYIAKYYDEEAGIDENGPYTISTRNPKRKWDGYCIGGRYDGDVQIEGGRDSNDVNDTLLENNVIPIGNIDFNFICYAVVTPDGEWHEREDTQPWTDVHEAEQLTAWAKKLTNLLIEYNQYLLVGIDVHI